MWIKEHLIDLNWVHVLRSALPMRISRGTLTAILLTGTTHRSEFHHSLSGTMPEFEWIVHVCFTFGVGQEGWGRKFLVLETIPFLISEKDSFNGVLLFYQQQYNEHLSTSLSPSTSVTVAYAIMWMMLFKFTY